MYGHGGACDRHAMLACLAQYNAASHCLQNFMEPQVQPAHPAKLAQQLGGAGEELG